MPDETQNQSQPNRAPAIEEEALTFEPVDSTFQVRGGAHRSEPGCVLQPSGNVRLNAAGADGLEQVAARSGRTHGQYGVRYGVDAVRGLVAVYATDLAANGAMPLRRRPNGRPVAIHIGALLKKYPILKPSVRSECPVAVRKDATGEACLVISVQMGQPKLKGRRGNAGNAAAGKPESTAQSAPAKPETAADDI